MKRVGWFLVLLFALILPPLVAQAHSDGTAQLIGVDLGTCQVSAWTWPDPLVSNTPSHVSVLVVEKAPAGETGDILMNSEVEVVFTPQDQPTETFSAAATHELADVKFFYETEDELPVVGTWDVLVKVQDDETACTGEAGFSVVVTKPGINWLVIIGVGVVLVGAAVLGFWQLRRQQNAA